MARRVAFATLGCKVNQYDTDALAGLFKKAGYNIVGFEEPADVYVVNTCTVTNVGDRKSRQLVRRAAKKNPSAVVVVTGCYAQVSPEEIREMPGVDLVVGTGQRAQIPVLADELLEKRSDEARPAPVPPPDPAPVEESEQEERARSVVGSPGRDLPFEELGVETVSERTRATLKIQEGCNEFCAYCKVPFARGRERSRKPENVLAEVRRLVKAGYKEVVLTGIHLGSYGRDLDDAGGIDLAGITRMVAAVDGLARVRLSSVEPTDVTPELIRLVAENPRVCRHLHIPLQSGNDATLERMNRKYSTAEFAGAVRRVRREAPGVAISTDVIVGFPGETDADFASSLDFVREMAFSRLHVFKYSPRKGTAAARFPGQAPGRVKEERSQAMIHLGEELSLDFHRKFVGEVLEVLFEQSEEPGDISGLTDNYIKVEVPVVGVGTLTGEIRPVRLMEAYVDRMRGSLA